jgi:hypothetical protein
LIKLFLAAVDKAEVTEPIVNLRGWFFAQRTNLERVIQAYAFDAGSSRRIDPQRASQQLGYS